MFGNSRIACAVTPLLQRLRSLPSDVCMGTSGFVKCDTFRIATSVDVLDIGVLVDDVVDVVLLDDVDGVDVLDADLLDVCH